LPVDLEPIGMPPREPARRRREEGEADRRPGDPGVRERFAMPREVAPSREARERAVDLAQQRGVVGERAQEAEQLVEALDVPRGDEAPSRERARERALPGSEPLLVTKPQGLERAQVLAGVAGHSCESVAGGPRRSDVPLALASG